MKTAFYDLSVAPVAHDFVISAMKAKAAGCQVMVIVPGRRPKPVQHHPDVEVAKRVATILVPVTNMLGMAPVVASTRQAAFRYWEEGHCFPEDYSPTSITMNHSFRSIVPEMPLDIDFNVGTLLDRMRRQYSGVVAIHIREQLFQPELNSNIPEWIAAAAAISEQGFRVVFVPDFRHPETEFGGHEVCREAGQMLAYRVALMKVAMVNLMIQMGHAISRMLSPIPALIFNTTHRYRSANWWKKAGIPEGTQPKWFDAHRRMVWDKDNASVIVSTFTEWAAAVKEGPWEAVAQ